MELTGNVRNEDPDEDWIYMERHHNNEINSEIWNLNDEDLNLDFNEVQESRFSTPYHDVRDENPLLHIIKWVMVFLCIWSSFCCISDNAMDILISFISAVFRSLGSVFPAMAGLACVFPKSLNLLKKKLGINKDRFKSFCL